MGFFSQMVFNLLLYLSILVLKFSHIWPVVSPLHLVLVWDKAFNIFLTNLYSFRSSIFMLYFLNLIDELKGQSNKQNYAGVSVNLV